MPERRYHRGCGKGCVRCWQNRLKHSNKVSKEHSKVTRGFAVKHPSPCRCNKCSSDTFLVRLRGIRERAA